MNKVFLPCLSCDKGVSFMLIIDIEIRKGLFKNIINFAVFCVVIQLMM